ncbi:MAG: 2-amino-4-hydroxy-6-hydroxymethyldihydropteridine diphosphokinase [Jatrophihabitantaceae bacterium]
MTTAVLSIGSNLGDRLARLQAAADAFRPWLCAASPVFQTAPWGPVPQGDYLNAVLVVADAGAGSTDWLARARAAEQVAGRRRDVRWGPRTLDVDVIDVDGLSSDEPDLTLPHPRAADRAFVLVPWLAAQPEAVLGGVTVAELLANLPDEQVAGVRPCPELALR